MKATKLYEALDEDCRRAAFRSWSLTEDGMYRIVYWSGQVRVFTGPQIERYVHLDREETKG